MKAARIYFELGWDWVGRQPISGNYLERVRETGRPQMVHHYFKARN